MNRKLYKAAYKKVLEKKNFYRHLIAFVIGNFVLFFFSLQSWTPAIFYLLTLIWIRVLGLHFANAYPEVIKDFRFQTEVDEDKAIEKEMKKIRKAQKKLKKQSSPSTEASTTKPLKLNPIIESNQKYDETDLV